MKCWRELTHEVGIQLAASGLAILCTLAAMGLKAQTSPSAPPDEAAFRRVSNRLLCQCGCSYMVLSCNHLDCPSATYIRKTIQTSLAGGKSEDEIVAGFVEQYGARILPEPPREGFSLTAWVMPFLALVLGGGLVTYVLWQWKARAATVAAGVPGEIPEARTTPESAPSAALVEKYRAQIDQELEKE